jgi:hypothetical protein
MENIKVISLSEFESLRKDMEQKPYLLIVATSEDDVVLEKENINVLNDFNQSEIIKDRSVVFIMKGTKSYLPVWKGFVYVFSLSAIEDLNEAIFTRNRVYMID